jgi:hypothetical protein
MMTFYWGNVVGTTTVKHIIQRSIEELRQLIEDLDAQGYRLLGYNSAGIVIDFKESSAAVKDDYLYDAINSLKEMIYNHQCDINVLQSFSDGVTSALVKQEKQIKELDPNGKDITSEFFLLFDMLPEHIKKEIKIYIKNG